MLAVPGHPREIGRGALEGAAGGKEFNSASHSNDLTSRPCSPPALSSGAQLTVGTSALPQHCRRDLRIEHSRRRAPAQPGCNRSTHLLNLDFAAFALTRVAAYDRCRPQVAWPAIYGRPTRRALDRGRRRADALWRSAVRRALPVNSNRTPGLTRGVVLLLYVSGSPSTRALNCSER